MKRLAALCSLLLVGTLLVPAAASASPAPPKPLTNLAHLDFLTTSVTPPAQAGHTTYRLAAEPAIGELWVYTNHQDDGSYQLAGGGDFDAASNTYGQGAYDADDVSRAAVVYLQHWQQFRDQHSRTEAYELLRGLTYLQTATGPNAGNVVLWMQPDGTLNPSPTPVELPNPSDSGASYWLARTIWALGVGYAQFRTADPAFAGFLKQRLDLAIGALQRQSLINYGKYQVVDGKRTPRWLIVDGADASAEAALGLAAYVNTGGTSAARTALRQLSVGIAALSAGNSGQWPYGALLPSAVSRSEWHAWDSQMPSALAAASVALGDHSLLAPAVTDATLFTAQLLTATGPDSGLSPAPVDGSQIAYGADSRVQALLSVGQAAHSAGLADMAGIAAGWFFGQNPSGLPMYDPATGVTDDGVSADGVRNLNSGAESTIHGLLSMLALDAHPALARLARSTSRIVSRDGQKVVEAEAGTLTGAASVVSADPVNTGEAQWSGGKYVAATAGRSTIRFTLPASRQPQLIEPIVLRVPGPAGVTRFSSAGCLLGTVHYGGAGAQGVSAAAGVLLPVGLARPLRPGASRLLASTTGPGQLDALLVDPQVARLTVAGAGQSIVLLSSRAAKITSLRVGYSGSGVARSYDRTGRLRSVHRVHASTGTVPATVWPAGFTIIS